VVVGAFYDESMHQHWTGASAWLVGVVGLVTSALVWAGEATLPDGSTVAVTLTIGPDGRLLAQGKAKVWAVRDLACVRLPLQRVRPWRAGLIHFLELTNGDGLNVQITDHDERALTVSTAWAARLRVPWANVRALRQRPDCQLLAADEFADESGLWGKAPAGQRELGHSTIGPACLRLAQQQSRTHTPDAPIAAGTFGVNVAPLDRQDRWAVELEWTAKQADTPPARVRIEPDEQAKWLRVDVPGKADLTGQVPAPADWSRLEVEWDHANLTVSLDELVLWSGRLDAPERSLRAVRLTGPARYDEFILSAARPREPPKSGDPLGLSEPPWPRPGTAVVQLVSGEVLFGTLKSVGRASVRLQVGQTEQAWPWSKIAAVVPMQSAGTLSQERGEWVAVGLQSAGRLRDRLTGSVAGLDQQRLKLAHPVLGELEIGRAWLTELRTILVGERIELDLSPRHLGKQFCPRFRNPEPDGLVLRRGFRLTQPATAVRLVVCVAHLPGRNDGPDIRQSLEQGSLRTEVLLNGQVIDYLNRYVDRASPTPTRLTVPLPVAKLQENNTLELRQRLDPRTLQVADCEILELIVEAQF
jgi:hypothetical protein